MPKEWWELVPLATDLSKLPRIPTEVWERILDKLDCDVLVSDSPEDRARTFAVCCLTCRAWLPRSRYHLFKVVMVRSKEEVKGVSKLLQSIPALRTRVEQLHVYGSKDGKRDASWVGLVGFHLGPKLKALTTIRIRDADFSLMKLEAYTFWGSFNRAWHPDAMRMLHIQKCTATHLNQLVRLIFATKAEFLYLVEIRMNKHTKFAPPAYVLPSGISLPLSGLTVERSSPDLVLPIPWHTLAERCPSLSNVEITFGAMILDVSSPGFQQFLVSMVCMFHRMQRHNGTNNVTLQTDSFAAITMRTRPNGKSANASNTPRIRRELVLDSPWHLEPLVKALTLLEDTMAPYINRRFHHIEASSETGIFDFKPNSFKSLDEVLSRLRVATHDVHVIIKERYGPLRRGCVVPWAREYFPMLTAAVPDAFCDLESGQPCESHSRRAIGVEQRRGRGRGRRR